MRKIAFAGSLLMGLLTLGSGCAAAPPPPVARPPLTADQARSFERGVDFVASLEGIEGRWRDDWDKDLAVRVGSADLIALVTVRTLRTDTDPEQRVTHRLLVRIDRELVGHLDDEVELLVAADDLGFTSVDDNLGRLSDKQFVAFVRRGPHGLYWHLSPASEQVITETESKITQLAGAKVPAGERVVVHSN